jgi:hypothetical protein
VYGMQMVHYLPPVNCIMPSSMPVAKSIPCTTHIPLELQVHICPQPSFLSNQWIYFFKHSSATSLDSSTAFVKVEEFCGYNTKSGIYKTVDV